ncbi:MAG: glycosyltransferase, partial [candidate division Zixibacteria bacterium]|nr:glycosyltransferase [candidate division Zixibacteria bacterium]
MSRKRVVIFGWANRVHTQRWAVGMAARGFEVKLISLGKAILPGLETVAYPHTGKAAYLKYLKKAVQEARKFKPDLVHAHYAAGFGLWALRTKIKPMLVSVWGADIIDFPSNIIARALIRRILKKADRITATSRFLKDTVRKLSPGAEQKTAVIPFGVVIPPEIAPLPEKPIKICFIKAHRKKYGPDILLKTLVEVKKQIPEITLSIAGEGEMTAELKALTAELGLEDCVRFVRYIDNREIYPFLRRHHFMVMPSVRESESFGVAVLEAGACGRPTVASKIGGVPEVIVDGKTGFLVPAGDIDRLAETIVRLAENIDLVKRTGQ